MVKKLYWARAALLSASLAPADVSAAGDCRNVTIPVQLSTVPNTEYRIEATFCEPSKAVGSRRTTIQILQHGAGYDRGYWSGIGTGQTIYSWVDYAAAQGFPTLAIDRLCNGASSHPNGVLVCQQPAEAEVLRQVVQFAQSGRLVLGSSSRAFTKVVLACHSVGSDICNIYSNSTGATADAILLTGWSNKAMDGAPTTLFGGIAPAFLAYPLRYGALITDPSYLTFSNEDGQRYLSYFGRFSKDLAHRDYLTQGTFTLGEVLTLSQSQGPSPGYTGAVFLLNGNEDATYCQKSVIDAAQKLPGNCSNGFADSVRSGFPNARKFGYHITANTGHCLNLHLTAQESFKAAHDFLTQVNL